MTHALREPNPPAWSAIDAGTGGFLRLGSVVPVLHFGADGTATGLQSQALDDEIRAEINAMGITWPTEPMPGPSSPHCSRRIPKTLPCRARVTYLCTEPFGHLGQHEARGTGDEVLATMPARKPSPRKRAVA